MAEVNPTKVCQHCNNQFIPRLRDYSRAKYCSRACCKAAYKVVRGSGPAFKSSCQQCGKEMICQPSQGVRKFCSRQCKHDNWKTPSADRGFDNLADRLFGRRTVLSYAGRINGHHMWNVRCSCAAQTESVVSGHSLKSGNADSCGCISTDGDPKPERKSCTKCGREFPFTTEFFVARCDFRWGLTPQCRPCHRPVANKRLSAFHKRLKREVLSHYSGGGKPRCVCCGLDTSIHFLTLDHINNDGKEDRKIHGVGMVFYARMKKLGYPPHLQTLCWNCNLGRRFNNGICPHKPN